MNNKDSLGNRIKRYEDAYRIYLPQRMATICRLDGKGWHNVTKKCKKPFDESLINCLNETAIYLCKNIQGVKLGYLQSDEISLLIYNSNFNSQGWFDNNLQKMVSISAAMASSYFTSISHRVFGETKVVQFDSRAFVIPLDEVVNNFEWRQQDCSRNSIQMVARANFSHKECNNKNNSELQEMLFQNKGINWNNLPTYQKRGRCIVKNKVTKLTDYCDKSTGQLMMVDRSIWQIDNEIPIFSQDRNYIEKYLV